ncbi:tyrosine-type recombinase/integrase [Bythopirellula goksoeyrii]|uniref:Tyrosine recombinase XerC n=1 Tax=Bythopirellula goksoeyrii TaxID=1400387 RepID=A0A5B9QQG5_9BACT|nr:site-specific integrase [Bythopirellula goksoeyrii]QEG36203.1 Tyrosine recombinase XerC [Bythopirellula goksoeyrii]
MSRPSTGKPWLHESSGYWCSSVERKRVYLDKDYKTACRKLRQLRSERKKAEQGASSEWLTAPISDLADEFLDDILARRKPSTHTNYCYQLLRALSIIGPSTPVVEIGKLHLAKIEQKMVGRYSPSTIRDTIAVVQTVYGWAVRHDLLFDNPLVGYEKPRGQARTRIVSPAEFQTLLRHSDQSFRCILLALRWTGCRPVEIRTLVWDWVDLEAGCWILRDHKTITRQRKPRPRIIPLPIPMLKLCKRLSQQNPDPDSFVFLNAHGTPYTKDTLCRKMSRVRKRAGIQMKAGEQLVLYSARHTFGTEASGKVSDIELAELMGHTDVRTTQRYVHIDTDRLKEIQRRAINSIRR